VHAEDLRVELKRIRLPFPGNGAASVVQVLFLPGVHSSSLELHTLLIETAMVGPVLAVAWPQNCLSKKPARWSAAADRSNRLPARLDFVVFSAGPLLIPIRECNKMLRNANICSRLTMPAFYEMPFGIKRLRAVAIKPLPNHRKNVYKCLWLAELPPLFPDA
jgi:hypothetical protein